MADTLNASTTESSLREKKPLPKADKYIWAIYIAILVISVVELYSASSREVTASNVFGPIIRHGQMLFVGVIITVLLSRMHYGWLRPLTPIFVAFTIMLGLYVLFKGDIINGARRSTTILGIAIQPAELLKLSVVLVIALVMSRPNPDNTTRTGAVIWSAVIVLICGGLLFSQGLTNTLLLMGISFAMMLIAGVEWKKFICVLIAYGILGAGAYKIRENSKPQYSAEEWTHITETGQDFSGKTVTIDRSNTQQSRIARWWGNDSVPKYAEEITSLNRQEQYSFMAQANGGVIGNLPGNSRETSRLPLAFSDYIFAIVVEDWGLIGGLVLLALYLWLLARAGAIASRCSRAFPALLVMGMAVLIVLQALFHMAIVTGVFPVSGQPLPLISKGGSSILATSIAFGIMLSVSRFAVQGYKKREIDAELISLPHDITAKNPSQL